MKHDTLSIRSERPQEPLTDFERSEFYLREGERLAHMGSWLLRAAGVFDYCSPETFAIFDFDPARGIPTLTQWLAVLGGGNINKLKKLPPGTRAGDNDHAVIGRFRLWKKSKARA